MRLLGAANLDSDRMRDLRLTNPDLKEDPEIRASARYVRFILGKLADSQRAMSFRQSVTQLT